MVVAVLVAAVASERPDTLPEPRTPRMETECWWVGRAVRLRVRMLRKRNIHLE